MKLYEALFKSFADVKSTLENAGLKDGFEISETELKSTKDVLFWKIEAKHTDATAKPIYVTFNIGDLKPLSYGDGIALNYQSLIILNLYTNKNDIENLVKLINDSCKVNGWKFDLAEQPIYNQSAKYYSYTFNMQKVIS